MPVPFSRTLRALSAERAGPSAAAAAVAAAFLLAWLAWLVLARVGIYAVSTEARVESAAVSVATQVAGRVARADLTTGRSVRAGDVLVELEAAVESRRLEEEIARQASLVAQLGALRAEVDALDATLGAARGRAAVVGEEVQSRWDEADAAATMAEDQASRLQALSAGAGVSELEVLQVGATARQRRAAADALRSQIRREDLDQRTGVGEREARLAQADRQLALLSGEVGVAAAAVARLGEEVERRRIRAPVDGLLAEAAVLHPGAVLAAGDAVATVVPPGELRVVAWFLPADALGRVQPGQAAAVRLDGFSWTEFGAVPAVVATVAAEPRDGRVRVELTPDAVPGIPLAHGLPGTVEIQVERASPGTILLRAAGQAVR